jgi:hypothetical protein
MKTKKVCYSEVVKLLEETGYSDISVEENSKGYWYLECWLKGNYETPHILRVSKSYPITIIMFSEILYKADRTKRDLRSIARKMNSNPNTPTFEVAIKMRK